MRLSQYYGRVFEQLLDGLLTDIGVKFVKHPLVNGCCPDYVAPNGRWIDAKLSEWSIFRCETLEKYEPNCRALTIVYARGNEKRDEMISSKTRIISVHKLIKQLPLYRQVYYTDSIRKLHDLADAI